MYYVRVRLEGKSSSDITKEVRDAFNAAGEEDMLYITYVPCEISRNGKINEIELIFQKVDWPLRYDFEKIRVIYDSKKNAKIGRFPVSKPKTSLGNIFRGAVPTGISDVGIVTELDLVYFTFLD